MQTGNITGRERLVYVIHGLEIGGVEVALLSAVPALCRQFDLHIVVLEKVNHDLIRHLTEDEKRVFTEFNCSLFGMWNTVGRIVKYIVGLKPHRLICSLWRSSLVGVKVKRQLPETVFYAFIHSTRYFHFPDRHYTRLAMRRADIILTDSCSTRDFVAGQLGRREATIRVVSFLTRESPPVNVFEDRGSEMSKRPVRFLFLGSLSKVKNIPEAVRFVAGLRQRGQKAIFDLYGRAGDSYAEIMALIDEWQVGDVVRYRGPVQPSDRFGIFSQYDFYLQLSRFEGMAMSVAEAMQQGMVCIVTPVGEIPHYARDGVSALFVDTLPVGTGTFSRVEEVINNVEFYKRISNNSFQSFLGKPSYARSLIAQLY